MTVNALSCDKQVETMEQVFSSLEYSLEALRSLRARVIQSEDPTVSDDAGTVLGLYLHYADQLIAIGRELARGSHTPRGRKAGDH